MLSPRRAVSRNRNDARPSSYGRTSYLTAPSGFRLDAVRAAAPLAQAVAEPFGPVAIGLLYIIPLIRHTAQVLGAAPAIDRLRKNSSSGAVGHLDFPARTARESRHPGREAFGAGEQARLRNDAR